MFLSVMLLIRLLNCVSCVVRVSFWGCLRMIFLFSCLWFWLSLWKMLVMWV